MKKLLILGVAFLALIGNPAFAASATWSASPTDGNWVATGSENNWSGGVATFPGLTSGTSSDVATFLSSGTTTININSTTLNIGGITFGAASTALSSFTIGTTGGNSLFLASGGTILLAADTTPTNITETVNAPLVLGGSYTFSNSNATSSNVLDIGGAISNGTSGAVTLTLSTVSNATGLNTVSGNISNGTLGGVTSVNKTGSGKWILSGNNTFTGGVTLSTNQGSLGIGSATALGTGTFTIGNSVSFDNTSASDLSLTTSNPITLGGSFTFTGTHSLNLGNGNVTLTANPGIVVSANTLTFGGAISGAHSITKSGVGTLALAGADSFTGGISISVGAVNLQNNSALGTGAGASSSGVSVTSGAALQLQGGISTTTAVPITSLNGTGVTASPNGALENVSSANTYSGAITLASASSIGSDAGTLTLTGGITNSGDLLTFTGAGNTTVSTTAIAGLGGLTKAGSGTLTLSAANSYTGATSVNLGTLALSGGGSLAATIVSVGNATITPGVSGNATLLINGNDSTGSSVTLVGGDGVTTGQGTLSLVDGTINTFTMATNLTIGNATGGTSSILDFEVGSTSDEIVLTAGKLATKGAVTINVTGLGGLNGAQQTLIFAGSTSGTNFNTGAGTLFTLATTGNFGGDTVALGSDSNTAGTKLFLNESVNTSPTTAYYNGGAAAVPAQGGTTAFNSFVNGNTDTSNFSSTKDGLTNANGLIGSTSNLYLAANNLTIAQNVSLGQNFTVNSLNFTGTGTVSTPVATTIASGNTLTIGATSGYTDAQSTPVIYGAGTGLVVQPGALASTINANVALGNNQTWEIDNTAANALTVNGVISGTSKSLIKTGTGTLKLTSGNTYSGGTTANVGMLLVTNSSGSATGSGALSVLRGAALAGTGTSSGSSFAIGGTSGSGAASIYVGQSGATGDANTTSKLTLLGAGASTIANANLTFNLDTTSPGGSPGAGNELLVGNTAITFGSGAVGANPVTLTLNLQGNTAVTNVPYFVLIAGTGGGGTSATSQYAGLTFGNSFSADGGLLTPILNSSVSGSGNLVLALNTVGYSPGSAGFYGGQAGLFLFQAGGIDDIVVIPEPGTWALMLGGLAVLVFIQRSRRQRR